MSPQRTTGKCFATGRARVIVGCCFVLCSLPASTPAVASNQHGQLFLHGRPDLEYSSVEDPAGESALLDCQSALTTLEQTDEVLIWYVLASFPEEISPRVTGVQFGIAYDESRISVVDYGFADGTTNYRTYWYPGSGENVRVYFDEERSERLFEVAWFAGVSTGGASVFEFDSTSVTYFWNDLSPTRVESYGSLGFGEDGEFVCNPTSACCLPDGTCAVLSDFTCEDREGIELEEPTCNPDPCLEFTGACCLPGDPERCVVETRTGCEASAGLFIGLGAVCPPYACELGVCCLDGYNPKGCEILRGASCLAGGGDHIVGQTDPELCFHFCCCGPTIESSWGTIKQKFRSVGR